MRLLVPNVSGGTCSKQRKLVLKRRRVRDVCLERCLAHRPGQLAAVAVVGRAEGRFSAPRGAQARLPGRGSDRNYGDRRTAPQGFLAAENPPRAALPAARNGQAAERGAAVRIPICTWSPTANRSYLEDQQERIIDILKNAKQPMFLVCVSDQVRRLDESPASR